MEDSIFQECEKEATALNCKWLQKEKVNDHISAKQGNWASLALLFADTS